MQFTVTNIIRLVEQEGGFRPGDLWIVNDPYVSGTHLQDIVLISPYFTDGELFALLASTGHWMDIGGSVPGGWGLRAGGLRAGSRRLSSDHGYQTDDHERTTRSCFSQMTPHDFLQVV